MRPGVAVILDVEPVGWAHIAKALAEHVRWCRSNAIAVPSDVLRLADLASIAARRRQDPTKSTGWAAFGTPAPVDPLLVDFDAAAGQLGTSRRTVERLVADGDLASVRVRGAVRVRRDDLCAYVDALGHRELDGGAA